MTAERLHAQLRIAIARRDRVAELVLLARLRSVRWQPEPDYPVWTRRITRWAA